MKILVSDSSILIEFSKLSLLDKMFELDFEFAVPDLLFEEELIDLGVYSRQDLLEFGLRVESLDSDDVSVAVEYQFNRPALSLVDAFALALAKSQGWHLLTEDRTMRSVAQSDAIRHMGVLWIIDRMMDVGVLAASEVLTALEQMHDDPRCPVAHSELTQRIRRLHQ